ncbi:MAG: hypothetical protein M4579_002589 [Chaenotheca gracillima]|nr:MAG: hypothetical protein M4579_002589 [Chaenotheca gracillima]
MATPPLTIRNLTATALELKLVERYEPHRPVDSPGGGLANITKVTRNFTSLMSNTTGPTSPTSPELEKNSQSFSHAAVSFKVDPFKTCKTDVKTSEKSPKEVLRLTFDIQGEKYRVDTPPPSSESTTLAPLVPNPRFQITAVYHSQHSHLSLYSSAHLFSWMKDLKDETPLSALSIPGTHNSPTCYRALPSVRCQAVGVREQLDNGVRFLDIRVQPESPDDPSKDGLILVHGVFPISLTGNKYFRDLVNDVNAFLDQNPTETVIMSVKREGPGKATDEQLSRILKDHYAGDANRWFTEPRIPTLGEARRKIILIRRFAVEESLQKEWGGKGWAIDAETWAYNTPNDTCHSGEICVQDFCEVLEAVNIDKKIKYCEEHLERAGSCVCPLPSMDVHPTKEHEHEHKLSSPLPFYINFLSASNFWKVGCWPEKIAAKLNPAMVEFLCRQHNAEDKKTGDGSTGIVVCDWVGLNGDWDLVRCVVGMNSKLELREKSMK